MSFRIVFLLTLLVLPSQGALKDYLLEDIGRASSRIRVKDEYKHGFVLKNLPGAKPFNATVTALLGYYVDGLVLVYNVFKLQTSQGNSNCSKDRDILKVKSRNFAWEPFTNCSHYFIDKHVGYPWDNDEVTISYARRENSTSRFELTLTAYTDPPCGNKFECRNKVCISAELRCDGRENCGDGSDEGGCSDTCRDGSDDPGCDITGYCGDEVDESGCDSASRRNGSEVVGSNSTNYRNGSEVLGSNSTNYSDDTAGYKPSSGFYIFLYVALGIALIVCLVFICLRWQEIFKKCCKRRTDTLPT